MSDQISITQYAKKRVKYTIQQLWRIVRRLPVIPDNSIAYLEWVKADGDNTFRLDYKLTPESIVIDLGGYRGQWASDIYAMYGSRIHVFEPAPSFANAITHRFTHNSQVTVYPFGLAAENLNSTLTLSADGSSLFAKAKTGPTTQVKLVRAADFLEQQGFQMIDLIKINIEGGEYDLLDHLIQSGWIHRIRNIQVQFHTFVPDAQNRMRTLQTHLAQTHSLTYQFVFIWENWSLKAER